MKKIIKYGSIFFISLFLIKLCFPKEKKKIDIILNDSIVDSVDISITPDLSNPKQINRKIFGINIGFGLASELDKDSGFIQLFRDLKPSNLRFPGGTVGNWYHPNLPVYGFKRNELQGVGANSLYNLQSKRSENILNNLIRICKLTNCGVVYCANLYFGNMDEYTFVIDELRKNNIPIYGIELGNEFCLLGYRKPFPDALAYIKKVKQVAIDLRKKYPDIPIAAVAGDCVPESQMDIRSRFMRKWNQDLNKENFYDAYVWHIYQTDNKGDENQYFDSVFIKNNNSLSPIHTKSLESVKKLFQNVYDTTKKTWITEWNLGNAWQFENTFIQGAFVSEFFLSLLDLNTKYNNHFEISNLHALGGIISTFKGKNKPFESNGIQNSTYEYHVFKFLSTTLSDNSFRCSEKIITDNKNITNQFISYTFLNKDEQKVYLHFVNRSNKQINFNINTNSADKFNYTAIEAAFPYSVAGRVFFENDYPTKLQPAKMVTYQSISKKIKIAPYSIGYIQYAIK
jgi:alpha-L-arabinofuranosidase